MLLPQLPRYSELAPDQFIVPALVTTALQKSCCEPVMFQTPLLAMVSAVNADWPMLPPLQLSVPVTILLPTMDPPVRLKLVIGPLKLMLAPPVNCTAPLLTGGPLTRGKVPPLKLMAAPAAAMKLPPRLPPLLNETAPVSASTRPVLSSET